MKTGAATCVALLVCALAGCTTFDHPIVAQSGATLDPRLVGRWVLETAHVTPTGDELGRFLLGYAPVGFPDDPEPEFVFERAP